MVATGAAFRYISFSTYPFSFVFRSDYFSRAALVVFLAGAWPHPGHGQEAPVELEKTRVAPATPAPADLVSPEAPDWVMELSVDPATMPANAADAGGTFFLLVDSQYDLATRTTYYRYLKRLNTESALQDGSQLSVGYDPAYQTLAFHRLIIHRNGEAIDRLANQEFKLIQREEDHERQLYDSSLSALAVIEDTRVGDVMEYAFSVSGSNPVFGERFYWATTLSYTVPIGHIHAIFRHPTGAAVKFSQNATNQKAEVSEKDGTTIHRWHLANPEPLPSEGGLPADYDPWGWVEAASYQSWGEVNEWALEQYVIPESLPAELEAVVEKASGLGSGEEKVLAALRFVQDEIRYLGIFEGVHSHKPYPLETIMRRRFGDCKDKSLMLVSLLRRMGIEAYPALVRTDYRKAIAGWTPSPQAFDHLVTCAVVDGTVYWLDPTRSYQRGRLANLYFPDYGYSLVMREGASDLTAIEPQGHEESKTRVREIFRLPDYRGEATLEVVTTATGSVADSNRSYFASVAPAEIKRGYLNYYSATYDEIESTKDLEVEDDEKTNTFIVREYYRIPNLWQEQRDDDGKFEATFSSKYTYERLGIPSTKNRRMPFAIGHPVDVEHRVDIHLPAAMNEKANRVIIEDPGFRFEYKETFDGPVTRLFFAYKSLADRVEPDRVADYIRNIRKAEDHTSYSMWISRDLHEGREIKAGKAPYRMNWMMVVIALSGMGIGVGIVYVLSHLPMRFKPAKLYDPALDGLRGWLVMVGLGVWLRPVFALIGTISIVYGYDLDTWESLTEADSPVYDALWGPVMIAEVFNIGLAGPVYLYTLVMFMRRHRLLPALMISILTYEVLSGLFFAFILQAIPGADAAVKAEFLKTFFQSLVAAVIWIPYFFVSKRVASTFRKGGPDQVLPSRTPPPLPLTASPGAGISPPASA